MESPSAELRGIDAFVAMVRRVLEDGAIRCAALAAARALGPVDFSALDVTSFRQTWPDASCGFGGIAAQVLTDAQTVVVSWKAGVAALVYVRGEFAYMVEEPTPQFWDAVWERRLPGAADPRDLLGR
jgi:hypothetical protein